MYKKLFLFAPIAFLASCGNQPEETPDTESEKQVVEEPIVEEIPVVQWVADTSAEEEIQAYLSKNKWEGTRHESGMYVVIDSAGTGEDRPNLTHDVTIYYQGYLLDGSHFDGTADAPATFPLANLITGWQIGIPMFGKGGKGKLIIPSGLAYGDQDMKDAEGNVTIPAGSTLMFEIELIDWQKAAPQQMFW